MTKAQLKIIYNAVKIRVNRDGENLDEVLASYNKLSDQERMNLRKQFVDEFGDPDLETEETVGEFLENGVDD